MDNWAIFYKTIHSFLQSILRQILPNTFEFWPRVGCSYQLGNFAVKRFGFVSVVALSCGLASS
jgi:hypothetical protein